MPQSLSKVYIHVVSSTKSGENIIKKSIQGELQVILLEYFQILDPIQMRFMLILITFIYYAPYLALLQ